MSVRRFCFHRELGCGVHKEEKPGLRRASFLSFSSVRSRSVVFYSWGILSLTDSSRTPFFANLSWHSMDSPRVIAKYLSFQTTT